MATCSGVGLVSSSLAVPRMTAQITSGGEAVTKLPNISETFIVAPTTLAVAVNVPGQEPRK
eukprot:3898808-Pyramimonas_sp.AAC.1